MLFNSYAFILGFLPITLIGFYTLRNCSPLAATGWLTAASLFFYGWWSPVYLPLILASITGNYGWSLLILREGDAGRPKRRRLILLLAIATNLTLLAYFKYANFLVDNLNALGFGPLNLGAIILPIGISFFTFTQIAYLVDVYQGKTREPRLLHYALFVTYFPHLVAGPILHHKEMMPQFARVVRTPLGENLAVGLSLFVIGLFKKVVIADGVSGFADPLFAAAHNGGEPAFIESWCGALAYSFQLYFDFSGYSDMAVGLSRMFGIRLPLNFNSPYKAVNIADFWRRWHITLSRFLRDYLYIPLGGNRYGKARRYANLMITMLLGGLWHGAGWNFVIWGGLHGAYLVLNHAWRWLRGAEPDALSYRQSSFGSWTGRVTTFIAVIVAWVFFRAKTPADALSILSGMIGWHGLVLPDSYAPKLGAITPLLERFGWRFAPPSPLFEGSMELLSLTLLLLLVWFLPNSHEIMRRYRPALSAGSRASVGGLDWRWRPDAVGAVVIALLGVTSWLSLTRGSVFLYFQF